MAMESTVAAAEDCLIGGLDFRMPKTGAFVTDRRSITMQPASGNFFSPVGLRLIRINLASSSDWLIGESCRLSFVVTNADPTNPIQPCSVRPSIVFSRVRVLTTGGQLIEDISGYNRCCEMLALLESPGKAQLDAAEGFGSTTGTPVDNRLVPERIGANASRRVTTDLKLGILNTGKWLPLAYCPLTIELELDSFASWCVPTYTPAGGGAAVNLSQNWSISDVRLWCDVGTLDSGLQSQFANHLISARSLAVSYSSMVSQVQGNAGAQNAFTVLMTRGFTRLKTIFLTMIRDLSAVDPLMTALNTFYHPHGAGAYNPAADTVEFTLQLGSKRYPEYSLTTLSEAFMRLRLAIGKISGDETMMITGNQFRQDRFILAIDTEKASTPIGGGASFTGASTRGGELLVANLKGVGADAGHAPTTIWVVLHYDGILNIRLDGCEVLD